VLIGAEVIGWAAKILRNVNNASYLEAGEVLVLVPVA
jgi:hypothetical protein